MEFSINSDELAALSGLPHIQQLAYLRGIRPYMDVQTGIVGVNVRISRQSIAEQLYIEPHQGIKSQSCSRDQVRRALVSLERAGVIVIKSERLHLILKCQLATLDYFVQNKAAPNPPEKAALNPPEKNLVNTGLSGVESSKADLEEPPKAALTILTITNKQTELTKLESNNALSKKCISSDFYPNPETIAQALAKGLDKITDPSEIQAFISYNQRQFTQFADFNPVFIHWLEREAKFRKNIQKTKEPLRSNRNECNPNQNHNVQTAYDRVLQHHQAKLCEESERSQTGALIEVKPIDSLDSNDEAIWAAFSKQTWG